MSFEKTLKFRKLRKLRKIRRNGNCYDHTKNTDIHFPQDRPEHISNVLVIVRHLPEIPRTVLHTVKPVLTTYFPKL